MIWHSINHKKCDMPLNQTKVNHIPLYMHTYIYKFIHTYIHT